MQETIANTTGWYLWNVWYMKFLAWCFYKITSFLNICVKLSSLLSPCRQVKIQSEWEAPILQERCICIYLHMYCVGTSMSLRHGWLLGLSLKIFWKSRESTQDEKSKKMEEALQKCFSLSQLMFQGIFISMVKPRSWSGQGWGQVLETSSKFFFKKRKPQRFRIWGMIRVTDFKTLFSESWTHQDCLTIFYMYIFSLWISSLGYSFLVLDFICPYFLFTLFHLVFKWELAL